MLEVDWDLEGRGFVSIRAYGGGGKGRELIGWDGAEERERERVNHHHDNRNS